MKTEIIVIAVIAPRPARYIRGWPLLACTVGTFLIYAAMQTRSSNMAFTTISAECLTGDGECRDVCCASIFMSRLSS
ncbi:hypothetical protein [Prosthecobacter sp.]|uniref:hypothetical protein n=1 Tax=Prosthecobacter sp. TaxID=1965333 RepID=UPI002AB8BEBC|nr:hypothetical protein [Prosthecobacter sp.]MDZ4403625.1 hypothetical protein [Prosthecobacter sp.]